MKDSHKIHIVFHRHHHRLEFVGGDMESVGGDTETVAVMDSIGGDMDLLVVL